MSTIVTRSGKGSPLSHVEVDSNFTNLNTDKIQSGNTVAALTITSATINGGAITGITDLAIADGGTGASDAATARTNLGLAIGTNVQAYDADLTAIAALAPTADNFIVGNGTAWTLETPAQARTSLGLGTAATVADSTLVHTSGNETIAGTKTFSSDASISGLTVGKGGGSETNSTVVGKGALAATNTVGYNTAFGSGTLAANTSGSSGVAIGFEAATANTTGDYNTVMGSRALYTNTTGASNTALGYNALRLNTTASSNVAVGYQAGYSNTTGSPNTFIGYQAGYLNQTGLANTAVGYSALRASTVNSNTAMGYLSLTTNTTGASNCGFGQDALGLNTTGGYNSAFGTSSLYNNTTASNNTAVGYQCAYSNTTGTNNTFYGHQCGYYITTGSKNTIVGRYDGNQGGLDIRTASNRIVLSDGDGNPRAWFTDIGAANFRMSAADTYCFDTQNASATRPYGMNISFTGAAPNNTSQTFLVCQDSTNVQLFIYSNGTVTNRTGTYNAISDAKLKENIVDATPKLDKLIQARVVNYNLIGDELKQIGFVAQELETIFPSLIDNVPDLDENKQPTGEITKSVKLTVMIPILVKAIQELKAEVDLLKAQINGA